MAILRQKLDLAACTAIAAKLLKNCFLGAKKCYFHIFGANSESKIATGLKPPANDSAVDFGPKKLPTIIVSAYSGRFSLILNPDLLLGQAIFVVVCKGFEHIFILTFRPIGTRKDQNRSHLAVENSREHRRARKRKKSVPCGENS